MTNVKTIYQRLVTPKKSKVVIVGANFAGMEIAINLNRSYDVTIIDPWPYFEFLPNIHELVSGAKKPNRLRFRKDLIIQKHGHQFVEALVSKINPKNQEIVTDEGRRLKYDVCVITIGGVINLSGAKDPQNNAIPLKRIEDCQSIGIQLEHLLDHQEKANVAIIGGGIEGIEALGEILRRFKNTPQLNIHLIEKQSRLAPNEKPIIDREIRQLCRPYSVSFHMNAEVQQISKSSVTLQDGVVIPSDLTICSAGLAPTPLLLNSGLTDLPSSWAPVRDTLQSIYYDNIFIAGDAAQLKKPIRKQAYHAMDMGVMVAKNIDRLLRNKRLANFKPSRKPILMSFGDLNTFVLAGKTVLSGRVFSFTKEAVYQYVMAHYDPSGAVGSTLGFTGRASKGFLALSIPYLSSLNSFKTLSHLKILK